tara:strand:+ start:71 stop:445 length:375 start_codon:yes stop_codon:yes gene_type:complete
MNRISVLVRKIPNYNNSSIYHHIDYQRELVNRVKESPGFIDINNYIIKNVKDDNRNRKYIKHYEYNNNLDKLVNITTWTHIDNWYNWYNSNERNNIKQKYNGVIKEEDIIILENKNYLEDFFLL